MLAARTLPARTHPRHTTKRKLLPQNSKSGMAPDGGKTAPDKEALASKYQRKYHEKYQKRQFLQTLALKAVESMYLAESPTLFAIGVHSCLQILPVAPKSNASDRQACPSSLAMRMHQYRGASWRKSDRARTDRKSSLLPLPCRFWDVLYHDSREADREY